VEKKCGNRKMFKKRRMMKVSSEERWGHKKNDEGIK
jgi:hypothetical protein